MDCFIPGRVLVSPHGETEAASLIDLLAKEFSGDFEFEFGVGDILRRNELDPKNLKNAHALPFVGRVPEGNESEMASRIAQFSKMKVGAAVPDYLVRPASAITIDQAVIAQAMSALGANPPSSNCGKAVVGILDSGVDPALVPSANLRPHQYDALSPTAALGSPIDQLGHGSLVARIVSEIAPAAELISVRAITQSSAISSVVAALYLAHAAGPCDVLNLSLSINCAPIPCAVCQTPTQTATNIQQLDYFFQAFRKVATNTILIAAAGNNVRDLTLPADFDQVIAVGSFDFSLSAPISSYHKVPKDRFVLAPGGSKGTGSAYAQRAGFANPEYLYGTSFAAAFVTGFAARVACAQRPRCGTPLRTASGGGLYATVLAELAARSNTSWQGFDPALHGVGAIQF